MFLGKRLLNVVNVYNYISLAAASNIYKLNYISNRLHISLLMRDGSEISG